MEERWNLERDDPEVAALLEAFLVKPVLLARLLLFFNLSPALAIHFMVISRYEMTL
jgi:hypothetical protein